MEEGKERRSSAEELDLLARSTKRIKSSGLPFEAKDGRIQYKDVSCYDNPPVEDGGEAVAMVKKKQMSYRQALDGGFVDGGEDSDHGDSEDGWDVSSEEAGGDGDSFSPSDFHIVESCENGHECPKFIFSQKIEEKLHHP